MGRRRDRFSHDRHLFHALLNLVYGFSMFEQVYRYDEGTVSRSREVWRVSGTHTVQPDHRRQPVTTPLPITRVVSINSSEISDRMCTTALLEICLVHTDSPPTEAIARKRDLPTKLKSSPPG